ncbi:MAG: hypothetical protein ACTHNW_18215 [Mucilaginibacter sp.]
MSPCNFVATLFPRSEERVVERSTDQVSPPGRVHNEAKRYGLQRIPARSAMPAGV